MKLFLLLLLLIAPFIVRADQPRWKNLFTGSNGKYDLRLISTDESESILKWSLFEKASGKMLYQLAANVAEMTVLVSDNGKNIVAIDDYSPREAKASLDVLSFYKRGRLVRKYTLGELLPANSILKTVSHFQWLNNADKFSIAGSRLKLSTFELVHYIFNVKTGEKIKKESDAVLSDDAIYAFGRIVKDIGSGRYAMEVYHVVQGSIPASGKIEFQTVNRSFEVKSYVSVIIKAGKAIDKALPRFNHCN